MEQTFVERLQRYVREMQEEYRKVSSRNVEFGVDEEVAKYRRELIEHNIAMRDEELAKITADIDCLTRLIENEKSLLTNE